MRRMNSEIKVGNIRLVQTPSGTLAYHPAMKAPVQVDEKALLRFLLRYFREAVAA